MRRPSAWQKPKHAVSWWGSSITLRGSGVPFYRVPSSHLRPSNSHGNHPVALPLPRLAVAAIRTQQASRCLVAESPSRCMHLPYLGQCSINALKTRGTSRWLLLICFPTNPKNGLGLPGKGKPISSGTKMAEQSCSQCGID